jgi:hypothetical protein
MFKIFLSQKVKTFKVTRTSFGQVKRLKADQLSDFSIITVPVSMKMVAPVCQNDKINLEVKYPHHNLAADDRIQV